MAAIIGSSSQHHIRSISLPSSYRPSQFMELKSPETVPLNAEALRVELFHLVNSVNELLQSLGNRQGLLKHPILLEKTLEDSVILLDLSARFHELLMTMRQHVQDIQSAFRRKGKGSNGLEKAIDAYISFRKKARRESLKCLKGLEKMERRLNQSLFISRETWVLIELTCLAVSVSQRIFLFVGGLDLKAMNGGWMSNVFLFKKKVDNRRRGDLVNDIESVDLALHWFCQGRFEDDGERKLMMKLKALDDGIRGLEDGINGFFRCLIRTRVSLLNILTFQ